MFAFFLLLLFLLVASPKGHVSQKPPLIFLIDLICAGFKSWGTLHTMFCGLRDAKQKKLVQQLRDVQWTFPFSRREDKVVAGRHRGDTSVLGL
jgi:hypothetical protein